ncbi:hypothetical protein [Weissella confusa]|uniref:hypothetical protein n=1 Tax=Weissella confusa TaxID=1583 RepID=UPI001080908C|nr:hypothetical protein [Weissella confusa]
MARAVRLVVVCDDSAADDATLDSGWLTDDALAALLAAAVELAAWLVCGASNAGLSISRP